MRRKPKRPELQKGHPLAQGLVGAWLAYEGAGAKARDVSGRGNDGALQSGVAWTVGKDGPALLFDGDNWSEDYVLIDDSDRLTMGDNAMSIVCRFRADSIPSVGQYPLAAKDAAVSNREYRLFIINTTGEITWLVMNNGGSNGQVAGPAISAETIHTAVAYHDPDNDIIAVSLDGGAFATAAYSGGSANSTADVNFGRLEEVNNTAYLLRGQIIFTAIYKHRILSLSDARWLHSDPFTAFRPARRWWAVALDVGGLTHPVIGSGVVNSRAIIGGSP